MYSSCTLLLAVCIRGTNIHSVAGKLFRTMTSGSLCPHISSKDQEPNAVVDYPLCHLRFDLCQKDFLLLAVSGADCPSALSAPSLRLLFSHLVCFGLCDAAACFSWQSSRCLHVRPVLKHPLLWQKKSSVHERDTNRSEMWSIIEKGREAKRPGWTDIFFFFVLQGTIPLKYPLTANLEISMSITLIALLAVRSSLDNQNSNTI